MYVRTPPRVGAVAGAVIAAVALALAAPAVASAGIPWPYPVLTPTPANAVPHDWDGCVSIIGACGSEPVGLYSGLGGVELKVLSEVGVPHWEANVGPIGAAYTTRLGSTETTGSPGSWDAYVYIYNVQPLTYGFSCRYHASVTGIEQFPSITQIGAPVCASLSPTLLTESVTDQAWDLTAHPSVLLPPDAAEHLWGRCGLVSDPCDELDFGEISLLGGAEKALLSVASVHWNANVRTSPNYDGQHQGAVGSTKSTGTPGDYDVYASIYVDGWANLSTFKTYRCEYHGTVTGTEASPVVTLVGSPTCGIYPAADG